jgi:transposase-like protein
MKDGRKYSEDFKRKAVARMINGEPVTDIIKDLKVAGSQLYKWRQQMGQAGVEPRDKNGELIRKGPKQAPAPQIIGNGVNGGDHGAAKEAIYYLRHAEQELTKELATGKVKRLPKSSLYSLLALQALSGE